MPCASNTPADLPSVRGNCDSDVAGIATVTFSVGGRVAAAPGAASAAPPAPAAGADRPPGAAGAAQLTSTTASTHPSAALLRLMPVLYPVLATRPLLSTQHSAPSTQHSALARRLPPRPARAAAA